MADKKTYLTTDKAGPRVAGRHVPFVVLEAAKPGEKQPQPTTQVGFPLELTDAEAEYELSLGTIVLAPPAEADGESKTDELAAAAAADALGRTRSRSKAAEAPVSDAAQGS